MRKVGVSKEELTLSYFKYYEKELAEIPQKKIDILNAGASERSIVPLGERNSYLSGKDSDYCQIGYGTNPDGMGFVCNETYMSGVAPEMLDWWFPWHSVGSDLRYKIWDPEDHYFARADRADYVVDPSVPINQKTWNVSHYILEDTGFGPDFIKLNFKRPRDFGYDESLIGTEKCASMVCAIGEGNCAAAMTHKWYPHKDGVMLCSRFWIGVKMSGSGELIKGLPDGISVPEQVSKNLYAHNIKEFTNLASFLPQLYYDNKDNF
ncbi:MAG: phloretin hydrolase [Lachnospiraceae bacterium]|nr:phloretin hydrolase [Lachnospiraceae bacterium]